MTQSYEVHCVEMQRTVSSASVMSAVRESVISGVKGWQDTMHSSHIVASGKSYQLQEFNDAYPFVVGERMVFLCEPDNASGAYTIVSLVNLSTGTYRFNTNANQRHKARLILFVSLFLCLCVIGWFTTPFAVAWYEYKRRKVWPILDNANEALNGTLKSGSHDKASMERAISRFNGPKYIGAEFT